MSDKFLIKGGVPLTGDVEISGYKNSAGAVLAASLLTKEPLIIDNLPLVTDVLDFIEILKKIGAEITWLNKRKVKIKAVHINPEKIPSDLFEKMRLSVLLIGPLLARFKKLKIPHPGGDKIGLRPISVHIKAFEKFGVKIKEQNGFYYFTAPNNLVSQNIVLEEFSVTTTENLMLLASLAQGKTKIEICACEPQVQDLGNCLKKMGLDIKGIGTHTLEINGKKSLSGTNFSISPDLLEAGTFLIAFAATKGQGKIKNVCPEHLSFFLEKMKEIGVNLVIGPKEILVKPSKVFFPAKIQVLPYPGFPTDLQPQTSVLLTQAKGKSLIDEPLYENRFQHLQELRKMGADIEITGPHRALIFGKKRLTGSKINVSDIRAGAALIIAALMAKGQTLIEGNAQIERGYEKYEEKLRKLGARIEKV